LRLFVIDRRVIHICYTDSMIFLFTFVLGIIIGSFLNVLILRMYTGRSIVFSRSQCLTCNHMLTGRDLIPVLSFIFSHGRCRYCDARISRQYILVELLTGFLSAYSVYVFGMYIGLLLIPLIAILITIGVYDIYHQMIPDVFNYFFIVYAFVWRVLVDGGYSLLFIKSVLTSGVFVALPLLFLWFVSRGRAMGFGDVKFAFGMGILLGTLYGLSALLLAFWIGAVVSIASMLVMHLFIKKKGLTMKSSIPFAPYLIIAVCIVFFFPINVFLIGTFFSF